MKLLFTLERKWCVLLQGEPLSGQASPASSSSENVQPHGGRSGEETDTDTIKSGQDKSRKQLTATASQRLRKWRRLPATNGIDEEGAGATTYDEDPGASRAVLGSRNSQQQQATGEKKGKTLRELRESKRNGDEMAAGAVKRAVPSWSASSVATPALHSGDDTQQWASFAAKKWDGRARVLCRP